MTPSQSKLARCRVWLGISNVGCWVLLAAVGLLWLSNYDTRSFDIPHLGLVFVAAMHRLFATVLLA